ncbi:AraC family transcriptional regulator [Priestia megaterium]|jgi:AraC-like DNA-binding protein|uniref:AraC family transcriptional regulator n=1 Tax=Priestia TaxID=2800373 RepID=UPI000E2F3595|nr:AraC family transcriptional regulator [Priestia megaterium]RFB33197.1 AraC family transcriptional regulator [Bacillus sp. RC]MCA4157429.1 AraC family transcriptional regulator [Priestia megaterium]MCR8867010.1 AraC family transcriptional regulator [Priestia megaterium]MDC7783862.1 AraC family transcriptional regulator [Priestia megaterium]MDR0132577.1 AraC family transcriptional regulator [Priestia megaterium]
MDKFIYKKSAGITALSASMTDFTYKKHAHQEYAIGVTLRGIQHYHLDGSLHLSYQNGVMLFNPEQAHDGMAHDETGLDYVMLYIEPQLLLEVIEKKDIVRFSNPIVYDYRLEKRILSLANAILSEKDEILCSELLLSLTDSLVQTDFSTDFKKDNALIRKAKDILHTNLENVLKLDEICKELDLSKFQFIRLFKAHTGISPYQYFLNCKIERAKQLIEKNRDIYVAVAECGFVDLTHLNKHFKSVYGTTAFEYMSHLN